MTLTDLHVNIGEVKVGSGPAVLRANLGSCLGICFLWDARNVYGLAHCFLPRAEKPSPNYSARYVDEAIPALLELMKITSANKRELRVILVGGSRMMAAAGAGSAPATVGDLNILAARRELERHRLVITREDTSGFLGRQIRLNCMTGQLEIIPLPRLVAL